MPQLIIPYFTTSRYRVQTMVDLAQVKTGERGIDLGSGDGRIVIAFAEKGVQMVGLEIDQNLVNYSQKLLKEKNLANATIQRDDLWSIDLSRFDIITIYPMPDVMDELEAKLRNETKKTARILTNYYPLPTWKHTMTRDHIYLYTHQ